MVIFFSIFVEAPPAAGAFGALLRCGVVLWYRVVLE